MAFRVLSILRVGAVSNIAVGTAIKCTNIEENVVEKSQPFGGITMLRCRSGRRWFVWVQPAAAS